LIIKKIRDRYILAKHGIISNRQLKVNYLGKNIKIPGEIFVGAVESPSQYDFIAHSVWAINLARAECLPENRKNLPFNKLTPEERACIQAVANGLAKKIVEKFGLEKYIKKHEEKIEQRAVR